VSPSAPTLAPNGWTRALLRGFKAGERPALTEVYRDHASGVGLLLRHGFSFESSGRRHRFVGYQSAFELQDLLHETFRRAFEPSARMAYDGIRPYAPYVKTIARNLVLRSFRAREVLFPMDESGAAVGGLSGPSFSAPIDLGPSPEREVHDRQVAELVAGFLRSLDTEDRRLVELRFVSGLSQRDVAVELGVGRQRLRTREQRVRARLLTYLRDHGETALVEGVITGLSLPLLLLEGLRVIAEVSR